MSASGEALWSFFLAGALSLTILVVALAAALAIAQYRVLGLHRTYGRRLLAAQDEERAAVASEVHDDAVQRLAALQYDLALWEADKEQLSEVQRRRLDGLSREMQDLGIALRALAHRLHPSAIEHGDLALVLEQLAEEIGRVYGLEVVVDCGAASQLRAPDRALALYRIAQEALRNVARHAGVGRARLEARTDNGNLILLIRDEGRGFDAHAQGPGSRNGGRGIGLLTIQERARLVGGSAVVTSQPGGGTTVRVTVPLTESAHG